MRMRVIDTHVDSRCDGTMEDEVPPTSVRYVVDVAGFLSNPRGVHHYQSEVPSVCREEDTIMGIDEAGRGPVLGPMVYGTSYHPLSRKEEFLEKKFADSKTLKLSDRERLFEAIDNAKSWIGWKVAVISPDYISNCMLQRVKYSLNEVSHDAAIDLIEKVLSDGVKLSEVYVDTVGDPRKYESKLEKRFPQLKITVAKKADSLFPVVSAASICAKVFRDVCVDQWSDKFGGDNFNSALGSGYPSDPATKQWLKDTLDPVFGYPSVVRFGWSTCQEKLDSKAHEVRWPDDDDYNETAGNTKISQFFLSSRIPKELKRHRYFEERGLKIIPSL